MLGLLISHYRLSQDKSMKQLMFFFSVQTASLIFLMLLADPLTAQTLHEQIGLTQLRAENPNLTEGEGVTAHLVEAGTNYAPDTTLARFAGITFDNQGPSTAVSAHSTGSATQFFGSSGVARDLGTAGNPAVQVYAAALSTGEDWINGLVSNFGRDPDTSLFDRSTVSNHSYILNNPAGGVLDIELLQRLDFIINETDTTVVSGSSNNTTLPPGWAPAFNNLLVGQTRGTHGQGLTSTYGSGRVAVDVVVPVTTSSAATPVVAGSVAILQDAADGSDAATSEVIRATIMAGATKDEPTSAGDRSETQPLDSISGAGELNILNSYNIQQGGECDGGAVTPAVLTSFYGWDYESNLSVNGQRLYEFEVTTGNQLEDFSVVLAWNQRIVDTNPNSSQFAPVEELANLSLELLDSSGAVVDSSLSAVDNVEHVFQNALAAGTYQLRVSNDNGFASDYGLAWRGDLVAAFLLGDVDMNGAVNFSDIPQFIAVLLSGDYQVEADCNQDDAVDFLDIPPYVAILTGS